MEVISMVDWVKILMMLSGGIMTGGIGILGWGLSVERRLTRLETDNPRDTRNYLRKNAGSRD
jgi:hypothetical protein